MTKQEYEKWRDSAETLLEDSSQLELAAVHYTTARHMLMDELYHGHDEDLPEACEAALNAKMALIADAEAYVKRGYDRLKEAETERPPVGDRDGERRKET